ncbi:hypothetical protein SB773_32965, partial [Bacillus sp. SIMBA_074]
MNKDVIYDQLRLVTMNHDFDKDDLSFDDFTSSHLAKILGKKRNLISHTLNELVRSGEVIKINT